MKAETIKRHLRPYSIYQRRKTTINHAFASALAPCSHYDPTLIKEALSALGQSATGSLVCVYCSRPAETWDHLTGLVQYSELHGFGHQIGNLVPACRDCNSRKGNKDWRSYVTEQIPEPRRTELIAQLSEYQGKFAAPIDIQVARQSNPQIWARYDALRAQIHDLMKEADETAGMLRESVASLCGP